MKRTIFIIFILMLFLSNAFASEEGVLSFSSFFIKSEGIGESGSVVLSGEKNEENEITSLSIEAFGKEYQIPEEDLKNIPKLSYNGIQLSYEHGYKELGGKTIYISFHVGFNSGITKKVLITLTEEGKFKIK